MFIIDESGGCWDRSSYDYIFIVDGSGRVGIRWRGETEARTNKSKKAPEQKQSAEGPQINVQAETYYQKGMELMQAEDYEEALVCFRAARSHHHPRARRAIAICQEKIGNGEMFFQWGLKAEEFGF